MIPIDDLQDSRLDDYRAVMQPGALREQGLFVAEGRLVVERLVGHGRQRIRSVLLTTTAAEALGAVVAGVPAGVAVYVTSHAVMNTVAGFNIHRGCLAIAERPPMQGLADLGLSRVTRLLVAEGVSNPDNVGGLFRNAAALGADAVVLGPECGDPYYRKAIRTSMAATLMLPWATADAWPDALQTIRDAGLALVACTPAPDAPSLHEVSLPSRAAVLVGAEGFGLSPDALARADVRVRIPMHGAMDSLNVATAAAIVLSALERASRR